MSKATSLKRKKGLEPYCNLSLYYVTGPKWLNRQCNGCNMRSKKADFQFNRQVGTGTYGVVWQAVRTIDGKTYAIKELDLRYLQKRVRAGF